MLSGCIHKARILINEQTNKEQTSCVGKNTVLNVPKAAERDYTGCTLTICVAQGVLSLYGGRCLCCIATDGTARC
jgi:hypothetical protein